MKKLACSILGILLALLVVGCGDKAETVPVAENPSDTKAVVGGEGTPLEEEPDIVPFSEEDLEVLKEMNYWTDKDIEDATKYSHGMGNLELGDAISLKGYNPETGEDLYWEFKLNSVSVGDTSKNGEKHEGNKVVVLNATVVNIGDAPIPYMYFFDGVQMGTIAHMGRNAEFWSAHQEEYYGTMDFAFDGALPGDDTRMLEPGEEITGDITSVFPEDDNSCLEAVTCKDALFSSMEEWRYAIDPREIKEYKP